MRNAYLNLWKNQMRNGFQSIGTNFVEEFDPKLLLFFIHWQFSIPYIIFNNLKFCGSIYSI